MHQVKSRQGQPAQYQHFQSIIRHLPDNGLQKGDNKVERDKVIVKPQVAPGGPGGNLPQVCQGDSNVVSAITVYSGQHGIDHRPGQKRYQHPADTAGQVITQIKGARIAKQQGAGDHDKYWHSPTGGNVITHCRQPVASGDLVNQMPVWANDMDHNYGNGRCSAKQVDIEVVGP